MFPGIIVCPEPRRGDDNGECCQVCDAQLVATKLNHHVERLWERGMCRACSERLDVPGTRS